MARSQKNTSPGIAPAIPPPSTTGAIWVYVTPAEAFSEVMLVSILRTGSGPGCCPHAGPDDPPATAGSTTTAGAVRVMLRSLKLNAGTLLDAE